MGRLGAVAAALLGAATLASAQPGKTPAPGAWAKPGAEVVSHVALQFSQPLLPGGKVRMGTTVTVRCTFSVKFTSQATLAKAGGEATSVVKFKAGGQTLLGKWVGFVPPGPHGPASPVVVQRTATWTADRFGAHELVCGAALDPAAWPETSLADNFARATITVDTDKYKACPPVIGAQVTARPDSFAKPEHQPAQSGQATVLLGLDGSTVEGSDIVCHYKVDSLKLDLTVRLKCPGAKYVGDSGPTYLGASPGRFTCAE